MRARVVTTILTALWFTLAACPQVVAPLAEPEVLSDAATPTPDGPLATPTPAPPTACPTRLVVQVSADSRMDIGTTGRAHLQYYPAGGRFTVGVDCENAMSPCGACAITGLLVNAPTTEQPKGNRRCFVRPEYECEVDADCVSPPGIAFDAGPCELFLPPMVATAGTASTPGCLFTHFTSDLRGTYDPETSEVTLEPFTTHTEIRKESTGFACPQCVASACASGPRIGDPCQVDSSGSFGDLSLECYQIELGDRPALTPQDLSFPAMSTALDSSVSASSCGLNLDSIIFGNCADEGGTCSSVDDYLSTCSTQVQRTCTHDARMQCSSDPKCTLYDPLGLATCAPAGAGRQGCFQDTVMARSGFEGNAARLGAAFCAEASGGTDINDRVGLPGPVRVQLVVTLASVETD